MIEMKTEVDKILKNINMASTTALYSIDNFEVDSGLIAGANMIMPNVTPMKYGQDYFLYENKPIVDAYGDEYLKTLEKSIILDKDQIGYNKCGDSKYYFNRIFTQLQYFFG